MRIRSAADRVLSPMLALAGKAQPQDTLNTAIFFIYKSFQI